MNIAKTRILIFETDTPAYNDLFPSINTDYFDIVAIVDNESDPLQIADSKMNYPVIPFEDVLDFSKWDLLIINDCQCQIEIMNIITLLKIPEERYIFLSKDISWENYDFYNILFKHNTFNGRLTEFFYRKIGGNYQLVSTEEGDWIFNSNDQYIPLTMFLTCKTFSKDEINIFIELTEKYYGTKPTEKCYFMDIGANVGTTCIYVKKKKIPNATIIAFEPVSDNYKLLKINHMLNDIDDSIIVNKAVMNQTATYSIAINSRNMGNSQIILEDKKSEINPAVLEQVESTTIKEFMEESNIEAADVKYVWIDTEGFETEVLLAAEPLLCEESTAFYLEYSPGFVEEEKLKTLAEVCEKYFTRFICIDDFINNDCEPRPIEELRDLHKRYNTQTNIFLIK